MASKSKKLRTGYTTGACAAAAAKAAVLIALGKGRFRSRVDIPFPDKSRHSFNLHMQHHDPTTKVSRASVIKDAGDDPDITNGAEIIASVRTLPLQDEQVIITGGKGVGTVTKPGLAVPAGEPAINPVPRRMIRAAVDEAFDKYPLPDGQAIEVTISVPNGEELAKKTLNSRLGIVGGISILGTTGIVKPLSAEAWTASITATMDVAKAMGCEEVVLSTGRVSEKAHMQKFGLPVEAYVMMGDYVELAVNDARQHAFRKIHISAHWAKMLKIAMRIPQTHVRHGAIDLNKAVQFLNDIFPGLLDVSYGYNTAREMYDLIGSRSEAQGLELFREVCRQAKEYAEDISGGIAVAVHLVSYAGEIIAEYE